MRATKASLKLDRISLIIHWVMLTVAASYLGWLELVSPSIIALLASAGGWTLLLTIVSLLERRIPYHRIAVLIADLILAFSFFRMVSADGTGLAWAGILPVLTAVLYFRFQGGALVSIGWTLTVGVILSIELGNAQAISSMTVPGITLVLTGLVAGMISQQVGYYLQNQQEFERIQLEKTSKQEQDRIRALYKIISSLTATLNFQKVLDRSLDIAADVLISPGEENLVVSAVLLFEEDELYIGSARRLTPSDYRKTLPGKSGIIIESLKAGQPRQVNDFSTDPELQNIIALRNCQAGYVYPLRTRQDLYGALVFGHPDATFFDETHSEILEIIGHQSLAALQNANLYSDLEQEKERIIDIQEDARKQLARDLHDGPTQSVAAIAMRVNFARRLIDRDVNKASDELYKIEDLARRATKEIRHMLFT
jgi:signal transduction histidine kinase